MKTWIVRFASLYVFNVALLLLVDLLFGRVQVGFHVLWASVILTLATLFLKPALSAVFTKATSKSATERTKAGEKVVQYVLVYVIELIIWVLTIWLSGVRASGFGAFVLPPLILLVGWVVYDLIDDKLQAKTAEMYDTVSAKISGRSDAAAAPAESPVADAKATAEGRAELNDGLTAEQRRMLDELG